MTPILVKLFALALVLTQITTNPDALRRSFDPIRDQSEALSLLEKGCAHLQRSFGIEDINVDDLVQTALDDPDGITGATSALQGLNLADLEKSYRRFCKHETSAFAPPIEDTLRYYNAALEVLPSLDALRELVGSGASEVLDHSGHPFALVKSEDPNRIWVWLDHIPDHVQKAFVAAEDRSFYRHKGIDERGLIRAFMTNFARTGRPQGGSTITQQLVKNVLVGSDVSYERKIKEMVLAVEVESAFSKNDILQLYLNSVYLGRGASGIEMGARSYFGKSATELTVSEGATLAALVRGPTFYNPDRHPDRLKDRLGYVLGRMKENGYLSSPTATAEAARLPQIVPTASSRRTVGFHYTDQLAREAKAALGIEAISSRSYVIGSTIDVALQLATEKALQEGLARYEIGNERVVFEGAEGNLTSEVARAEAAPAAGKPAWLQALETARSPLYDVHWPLAIVLPRSATEARLRAGLRDGRVALLSGPKKSLAALKTHDLIFVQVSNEKNRQPRAELRVRPQVQGAALVVENRTGRVLAMTGSFSYPLSQLNRATQSIRQPGSAIKPITYLAALQAGLQPDTLVRDEPLTLPPIGGYKGSNAQDWTPKNYDGGTGGYITLRDAIAHSKNLATVGLLDGGIDKDPERSLTRVCDIALELKVYKQCERFYPFVLGAQPVRPLDLALLYATIANEGRRPTPYLIETVERGDKTIYRHQSEYPTIVSVDAASFFQMKSMLQGVLRNGTASALKSLAPYVAGKTGTTDDENDAWFVGFTNDITIVVWAGYDNANGKRRTLGAGSTGARVALPIFESIVQSAWNSAPQTVLASPSDAARELLVRVKGSHSRTAEDVWTRRTSNVRNKFTDSSVGAGAPRKRRKSTPESLGVAAQPQPREWDGWSNVRSWTSDKLSIAFF